MLDRKGVVVSGLGPADFKVEIGGKPREIVSVDLVEYAPPSTDAATAAADAEITTNEPKENGRVILLVIDQASLASDARTVIESAQKWVRSMPAKDLIGLLTFPAPGPSVDFTADHAKVAEALGKVVGVGRTAPPFQQYNLSIWEAIRMDAQDLFVRGDVIGRECRANQPMCPTEVEMQVKTMILDAQSHIAAGAAFAAVHDARPGEVPRSEARRAAVVRLADERARCVDRDGLGGGRRGPRQRDHPHLHRRDVGPRRVAVAALDAIDRGPEPAHEQRRDARGHDRRAVGAALAGRPTPRSRR